jgi:hypothetical protein
MRLRERVAISTGSNCSVNLDRENWNAQSRIMRSNSRSLALFIIVVCLLADRSPLVAESPLPAVGEKYVAELEPMVVAKNVIVSNPPMDINRLIPIFHGLIFILGQGASKSRSTYSVAFKMTCSERRGAVEVGIRNHEPDGDSIFKVALEPRILALFSRLNRSGGINVPGWRFTDVFVRNIYRKGFSDSEFSGVGYLSQAHPGSLVYLHGSIHGFPLFVVDDGNNDADHNRRAFEDYFPDWRIVGFAVGGILLIFWGWFNLRTERRLGAGFWAFVSGCILWTYGAKGWLDWSVR